MDNKKQTVYVSEYDVLLPYEGETKTQMDYKADILVGKKSPKNYVGMISFKEPSLDETKSLIFSDYKAQAYVDAVGKKDVEKVIKAEEEGNGIFPSSNEGKSKAFDQPYEQDDYSDRYNTQLSEEEETEYQKWAEENGKAKDVFDYDMRGFWKEMKSGTASMDERGHASDKYKKPNHPTFSNESIYASEGIPGYWEKNKNGTMVYHAPKNIGKGQQAWLSEYFKSNEKGVGLAFDTDVVMEETNPAKREWLEYIENYVLSHNAPKKKNNWLKTSAKGFMSAGVNIFSSIDKGFTMMGSDFGVWFAELVTGDKLPDPFKQAAYRELADSIQNLDEKTWGGLRKITAKTEQDSGFAYNLSAGGGSLGLSWLGGLATKSAMFSATLFASSEAGDIYTYAREQGVTPFKAFGYASAGGVGAGALEKWGVQDFFDKYTIRNLKAFGGKIFVKQMGTEYTQEFSQSTLSNVIRMAISGEGDWREIFAQASEEGFYGAVVSPAVGGVHLAVTGKLRKKWSKVFQDRGMNKDDADRLATGLILDRDEAIKHAKEMIDDEAITQAMMSPEEKSVVLKEGEDLLAKLLDQKSLGLSDESQAIVDENAQKIKERAIAEGLSEEEAEDAAKLGSNLLKNTLSLATELGVTEEQIAKDFNFDITNAEDTQEKVAYTDEEGRIIGDEVIPLEENVEEISIDDEQRAIAEYKMEQEVASLVAEGKSEEEARAIVEKEYFKEQYFLRLIAEGKSEEEARAVIEKEELIEQEVARLVAEGKSEKDARFIVAEGREPTDADRAAGYNYIPYQIDGDIASRPYSNKQVEKMLENWQDNEDALLDLYDNHLGKYNNTIAGRIRFAAVWDLKKREYKPTPNEEAQREREVIKTEQANLKLPKKITLETLKKVIKDNGYTVIGEYTANTGSQYITVETDSETQDEIRISIRDHKRHSADYVRPDYDLLVEYDNSWQDRFEDIINRLNLKGAFVTKVKKYNELSRKLRGETQSKGGEASGNNPFATVELNAVTAEDPERQEYIKKQILKNGYTKTQADTIVGNLDKITQMVKDLAENHPELKAQLDRGEYVVLRRDEVGKLWEEHFPLTIEGGKQKGLLPRISAFKKNGDYVYNIDFGTTCTKREPLEAAIKLLIERGYTNRLGSSQVNAIKDALEAEGYEIPCRLCFVEGRRTKELNSNQRFSRHWNYVIEAAGIKGAQTIGNVRTLTEEQVKILKALKTKKGYEKYIPEEYRSESGDTQKQGITLDRTKKIAARILDEYNKLGDGTSTLANRMTPDMLLNSQGTDYIFTKYADMAPELRGMIASRDGAGTSKPHESQNVYDPYSFKDHYDYKRNKQKVIDELFEIAGVRMQSFTDFNVYMVLDYIQLLQDLAIRGMPAHAYTKVPAFVELFGEYLNINMSLIGAVDKTVDNAHAGLRRATQEEIDAYNKSKANGTVEQDLIDGKIENVYFDEGGAWTYTWAKESFDPQKAFSLRKEKRFKGKVGTIAVGISDKHIEMLLDDPRIDMIIPLHKSGIEDHILYSANMHGVTDYTDVQNTGGLEYYVTVKGEQKKRKHKDFLFNKSVQELKDAKKATKAYLEWCAKKGYTPKFEKFSKSENYYKVLEDIRSYDNDGKPVIQKAVSMVEEDKDFFDRLENALNDQDALTTKVKEISSNERLMKRFEDILRYERIDGELREIFQNKLVKALGGDNVTVLSKDNFLDELEKVNPKEASKYRTSDGIIYGFAHNGKIYLNINNFNAHTPAHEFSHVWDKVVQVVNPELWEKGVSLLEQTDEWQEVMKDKAYKSIHKDKNAVASEVLARIVGEMNEEISREFQDPNKMRYKGTTLKEKIKQFILDMWGVVRSIFEKGYKGEDLKTAKDFASMTIEDLWDDGRAAVFRKKLDELRSNLDSKAELDARYQTETEEKNLVVTHGTTLEKLEEALRLGAMPMPSLAVTKSELATGDQYGEITFVGGYDIINPNKDKANKTFAADIYSPRREKPEYELNSDGIEYIKRQTGNVSKKGDSYWTSNIEYALNNEQDYLLKEVYLASIGKISDLDGSTYSIVWEMTDKQKDDFKKWKNKLINEYTDKKIFKGVTPSGNRKYVPYDLKNILQELKQKALRGSEEGMGGTAHALRGVWADELKNIEEIRKRKDKLVDAETYKKLDNIIWDETAKLTDLLVSEKLAEDLANDLVNPEEYMIEEALKLIKPSSDIANILAKADLRSDKKAVDAVKKYMTLLKNTPVKYFESKPARAVDFSEFEGVLIPSDAEYDAVARELEEQGVKQVLRYGSKEEKNQLINRMQKVFFQTEGGDGGERKPIKPYKRNPLKVLGQYEPTKKMITLFKGRNPTTLIHEMGHHYLPIQLRLLEKAGKWDKLKPLYKELGISSVENMGRDAEEKLIDMFTSYIYYNEAPNAETQSIFERAKQWMISAYNTVKNFVKPSEEVTKFFDELIAGEETAPDISHLVGKEAELSKILQGARHGQELTINGLSMKDIAILRQALHARVPRRGRSLADVIRKAGGIDSRSEIAKALGYDSRKGGEMGFWNYRGTIDNEQALIELLVAEGFLFDVEQDSAEGVQAVWNKVEKLINNRDTTFSEAEQMQNEKRQQAYKVQEMVNNILVKHYNKDIKTLEEDMKAVTKKLADIGAVAVDKATLEYLQNSLAKMSKDYRKLLSEKKEKQYKYQEELTKFIKSSPLNNKDKLKLIDKIRMVKDERTFEKYLGEAKSQIEKYVEAESKRVLDDLIQKEIKSSKPRKVMAQLYDYANNKLFADLREWNKLNQTEAEIKADQLDEAIAKGNGELSRTDKLRRMFLEYKTFGKDCSVEFMQALHDEIKAAKQAGIDAKDDADFMRSFEREQDREAILEKIKESNFDKNSFVGKVVNAYRNGISNLYSMLNSLVGKEIAEKFQFETIVENKQVKEWKHLKKVNQKAQKIYGVKSYGELLNLMADKGKKMFVIYKKKDTESFEGSLSDDFYHELSVLDLIDIYNSMKNIKTSDDYAKAYGIEQINALLANLTEQDKAFADMLMEDVNSRYKAINKVYINLYGMDLKRVDNYWMSSTEHSTPIDVLNDMRMQSTTPGFFKERTSGSVIPLPKNAWLKYQNHIAQGYYMTEVAEKFKEMAEVFKSKRIENMITNKFGEKVYKTLIDQIEAIGLNASPASVDDMSKWYNKLVSNWVGAKIALNPVVFVGQLTSFTNYAVDVPTKAYLKNFMYALRHPKEVFDFMMKHNKDFLMHRYESGFNEAMSRFITQAESLNSMKFGLSPKSKFGWANILSSLVRMGDMGSLIFGGYGQFKTMLDNGMSVEEAKKKFEFATLRSQQSGNAASIAKIQRVPNGLSMLFLPFKNTAMQYGRKIVDTVVSYQNGDITKAQATKTLTNYLFIQPALWVFIRNIAKDILGLDDEDDEYTDGILEQILVNPIEMIPFAGESFKAVYSIIADEKLYGVYSMPLFDDIEKSWRKLAKEEKDIFDWVDIISPVVEGLTATPIQTPKRYAQKWFGEE